MSRGQSLVELAVCAPVVMLLALGGAAVVRVADAKAGLDAATQAAAASAARAPDLADAKAAAARRFAAVAAAYPLGGATLRLDARGLQRGDRLTAIAWACVDIGWGGMVFLPAAVELRSTATVEIESWRTHR